MMKTVLVTPLPRKVKQHQRWEANDRVSGEQLVAPARHPEFRSCLVLYSLHSYDGAVRFYYPGESSPYLALPSVAEIAIYGANVRWIKKDELARIAAELLGVSDDFLALDEIECYRH